MIKDFIEWTEGNITRGRKVVLFSTVYTYLFIMLGLFMAGLVWPSVITVNIIQLFSVVTGLMLGIYGFYTGTSSDKTAKLADKAADIMLKKIDTLQSSNSSKD